MQAAPLKRFIFATHVVNPGKVLAVTVTCPRGWIEIGGTVLENPSAVPVLVSRSSPNNGRRHEFTFDNRAGARPAEVKVRITCLKIPPPGKRRRVRLGGFVVKKTKFRPIRTPRTIRTPPCPKRRVLLGPGFEVRPPGGTETEKKIAWASTRETGAPVEVSGVWVSSEKGRERAEYRVGERGVGGNDIRISARCVKHTALAIPRGGGAPTHSYPFRVELPQLRGSIDPGINSVRSNCPKGFISLGTGFIFPPRSGVSVFRTFPLAGRGALWEIDSEAPAELLMKIQAHCLDGRPGWRRTR